MSAQDTSETRELSDVELTRVFGGMKWERNTANSDVIDARGGQIQLWFGTFTLDVHGKISGFTPR